MKRLVPTGEMPLGPFFPREVAQGAHDLTSVDGKRAEGDVITEVQGQKIENTDDFRAAIDKTRSGQTIRLYVTSSGRTSISGYRFITVP